MGDFVPAEAGFPGTFGGDGSPQRSSLAKMVTLMAWLLLAAGAALLAGCASAPASIPVALDLDMGMASYYADRLQGRRTACGERYDRAAFTAAHRQLPFGTRVRVVRLDNGQSVDVRINDRGPFVKGRVIDLSYAAARELGMLQAGVVEVRIMRAD